MVTIELLDASFFLPGHPVFLKEPNGSDPGLIRSLFSEHGEGPFIPEEVHLLSEGDFKRDGRHPQRLHVRFSEDVTKLIVDSKDEFHRIRRFMKSFMRCRGSASFFILNASSLPHAARAMSVSFASRGVIITFAAAKRFSSFLKFSAIRGLYAIQISPCSRL